MDLYQELDRDELADLCKEQRENNNEIMELLRVIIGIEGKPSNKQKRALKEAKKLAWNFE